MDPFIEERINTRCNDEMETRDSVSFRGFEEMRQNFFRLHEWDMRKNLRRACFVGNLKIEPVPLDKKIQNRFMKALSEIPNAVLLPTFHGTDPFNLDSICQQGLLIPGGKNALSLANGAWYGRGIYTSRFARCAGWYCSEPWMLICAVIDDAQELPCVRQEHCCVVPALSRSVKHADDQVIVFDEDRVVPLFQVAAEAIVEDESCENPYDFASMSKGKIMHVPSGAWAFSPPRLVGGFCKKDLRIKRNVEQRIRQRKRCIAQDEKQLSRQ